MTAPQEELSSLRGWIFYDGACSSCRDFASRYNRLFARRGFRFEPLQQPWVQQKLNLSPTGLLEEMRVLTADGTVYGGADAFIFLGGRVWWMSPVAALGRLPFIRRLFHIFYRWVATHRHCRLTRNT